MTPPAQWSGVWLAASAAALGAMGAAGLAPMDQWGATLLALTALAWVFVQTGGAKRAAILGWAFGTGWFAYGLLWITEPFMVDPVRHGWMAPFALVFLSGGLALFWGGAFAAAWWAGRSTALRVAFLILFWSLAEFARAYVFTGFPWGAMAQVWTGSDAILLLAWIGPHGLAFATLLITLPFGALLATRWRLAVLGVIPGGVVALATWGATQNLPEVQQTGRVVRIVQPNAPQRQKWDPDYMPIFYRRQLDYTAADPRPDLVVWPESTLPMFMHNADAAFGQIAAAARGAPVALGLQRREALRIYNSMVVIGAQGQVAALYDKHHLVPFGEYIPLGDLAARFGLYGFAANEGQGYTAGPGAQLVAIDGIGSVLPLICYEAVFPQDVSAAPARADLLMQLTNDAWFGTRAGPYQHLAQARMRAIEQGVPMVRSANTGVSAMIDPLGRVTASLPLGQAGFVDAPLPVPLNPTFYSRSGDRPVLILLLLLIAGIAVIQFTLRRANRS